MTHSLRERGPPSRLPPRTIPPFPSSPPFFLTPFLPRPLSPPSSPSSYLAVLVEAHPTVIEAEESDKPLVEVVAIRERVRGRLEEMDIGGGGHCTEGLVVHLWT